MRKQAHGKCNAKNEKAIAGAIKINEKEIGDHLNQLARQSVRDTINSLLDADADAICNATRYQHSTDRLDIRAGSYKRKLLTTSGEVELTVPRLRRLPFETQIIQRYQTKQSSVPSYSIIPLSPLMIFDCRVKRIAIKTTRRAGDFDCFFVYFPIFLFICRKCF